MSVIVTNPTTDPVNVNIVSGGGSSATVLVTNSLTNPAQDIPVEVHGVPSVTLSGTANSVEATIVGIPAVSLSGVSPVSFSAPQPVDVMNVPAVTLSGSTNAVNATLVGAPLVTLYGTANSVEATIVGLPVVSLSGGSSVSVTNSVATNQTAPGIGYFYATSFWWNPNYGVSYVPEATSMLLPTNFVTGTYNVQISITQNLPNNNNVGATFFAYVSPHQTSLPITYSAYPTMNLVQPCSGCSAPAIASSDYTTAGSCYSPPMVAQSQMHLVNGSAYDLVGIVIPQTTTTATQVWINATFIQIA